MRKREIKKKLNAHRDRAAVLFFTRYIQTGLVNDDFFGPDFFSRGHKKEAARESEQVINESRGTTNRRARSLFFP